MPNTAKSDLHKGLACIVNDEVREAFTEFPDHLLPRLLELRQLVVHTAAAQDEPLTLIESLKWGEPAYQTKGGSTIRIGIPRGLPNHVAMFFICSTKLVATFRELFGDALQFADNRAILLSIEQPIPSDAIKTCMSLALTYHRRKHLPLLGA
jgi:hypothetical protein